MKIYEEEELYWFRRSSEKWLLEGDNNTAYFHRVANGRRRKNTMYSLKKDDIHIQGTADLLVHATEYYKRSHMCQLIAILHLQALPE
jgi:hypothetical protein